MSDQRAWPSARLFPYALASREYRALDRAFSLIWSIALSLLVLTVCSLHVARAMPPLATPTDLGRRLFHVYFGLSHLGALAASVLVGAWLSSPAQSAASRDLLSLAGVSAGALVRARLAATLTYIGSVLVATSPIAAVPFFYDPVGLRATALGLLSVLVCATIGSLIGQAIGASAPTPRAAIARAALGSAALTLSAWHFVGRSLGRALSSVLRLAYHGSAWWPELAAQPTLDPGARRTLLVAPFVLAITFIWLAHTIASRASSITPRAHTVALRLALIASGFALADALARVCAHIRQTPEVIARGCVTAITVLTFFELGMLFVVLGEPLGPGASRASPLARALERTLGRSMLPTVALLLAVAAAQMGGLARRAFKLLSATSEGQSLARWEPLAVALVLFSLLVFAAGLGALLRVLLSRGGARWALASVIGCLWLLPAPVRFILGGADSPYRTARWVLALSPSRTLDLVASLARSSLTRADLRLIKLRSMPELALATKVTALELCLGLALLLAAAVLHRRRAKAT